MLELKSKPEMARAAHTIATSFQLVQHNSITYAPAHWLTQEMGVFPLEETVWVPLTRSDKMHIGNQHNILFANDSEITNFDLMLRQFSVSNNDPVTELMIRTPTGLKVLTPQGSLAEADGRFRPNCLMPMLNDDPDDKAEVLGVIEGWLNSKEEATSLLYHLATALSPGWPAVKYILLIGDGRNGKSVLLTMLEGVFGQANISNVTRQQIAEHLPVVAELNNKLLNIVFDGAATYIKDSSMEKTLIAGERAVVRMLYENGNTVVQTNALYLESLNSEPKARDKSSALQKRLSRFFFPNVYPLDRAFELKMRDERLLGAFLSLLIDHFVTADERAEKLQQTEKGQHLQVEQMLNSSPVFQYLGKMVAENPALAGTLELGRVHLDHMITGFMAWRVEEGYREYSSEDAKRMFKDAFVMDWISARDNGKVVRKQVLKQPKPETQALFNYLTEGGHSDSAAEAAVVED